MSIDELELESDRVYVSLLHFDSYLGPRFLFIYPPTPSTDRQFAPLSKLKDIMDFHFIDKDDVSAVFTNTSPNLGSANLKFQIVKDSSRGGFEEFMLSIAVTSPSIQSVIHLSSLLAFLTKQEAFISTKELIKASSERQPDSDSYDRTQSQMHYIFTRSQKILFSLGPTSTEVSGKDVTSHILSLSGEAIGRNIAQELKTVNPGKNDPIDLFYEWIELPILNQWGTFRTLHFDPDVPYIIITTENTIWSKSMGITGLCVDYPIAGLIKGSLSEIFGLSFNVSEMRCISEGAEVDACYFQVTSDVEEVEIEEISEDIPMSFETVIETMDKGYNDVCESMGSDYFHMLEDTIKLNQFLSHWSLISNYDMIENGFSIKCSLLDINDWLCEDCAKRFSDILKPDNSISVTKDSFDCKIIIDYESEVPQWKSTR
ncbi:MAG: hypothetical protein KAR35_07465 [Candidatus Heimdallarchaeota archaeon]|nr:hypothetical protein [Candidatus Heimdallarchaeota archaeon]MCK5049199.1 hypothetical protein [Candidatus Heimdallarchaeota archaeon]